MKWDSLVHSGVLFPPDYTSHGVKMLYDGKPVDLTLEQEEVRAVQNSTVWKISICFISFMADPARGQLPTLQELQLKPERAVTPLLYKSI